MELSVPLIAVPAILALLLKGAIYYYARKSAAHNVQTRLYLFFLFSLSIQNIAEILVFYSLNVRDVMPHFELRVFYGASIAGIALLFHFATSLAFDDQFSSRKAVINFVYACGLTLEVLLFTPLLIADSQRLDYGIGFSATRVPGPLYFMFELYAVGGFACVIGFAIYGWRRQATAIRRLKNAMLLAAIFPMAGIVFLVLGLLHFDVKWINASFTLPIAISYFLIVTAYATHQHRLFDIEFFLPWSKVRKRKTAFYQRIRTMVTEIADLDSVGHAVSRLSDTLRCPIALVGGPEPALAFAGNAKGMIDVPIRELRRIENIVVTNEIADTLPDTHALLKRHGVAAVVPFFPHSRTAASWMLLGDSFSEHVYTPLDFKVVEQLFDRLGEVFLDKLLFLRAQLHDAREQLQTLQLSYDLSQQESAEARRQIGLLQRRIAEMERERGSARGANPPAPVLSLVEHPIDERPLAVQLRGLEARLIERALQRSEGDIGRAAQLLGLGVDELRTRMAHCGVAEPGAGGPKAGN
jgi:hypothetical protein